MLLGSIHLRSKLQAKRKAEADREAASLQAAQDLAAGMLDISKQGLTPEDVTGMAHSLFDERSFTALDISGNTIGDEGATALAEVALANFFVPLRHVDMALNDIGNRGIGAVARALKANAEPPLALLDLSWNAFGDEGATALAEALAQSDPITGERTLRLRTLKLAGNAVKNAGGRALVEALEGNRTVRELDLSSNQIEQGMCTQLHAAARHFGGGLALNTSSQQNEQWSADAGGFKEKQYVVVKKQTLNMFGS